MILILILSLNISVTPVRCLGISRPICNSAFPQLMHQLPCHLEGTSIIQGLVDEPLTIPTLMAVLNS